MKKHWKYLFVGLGILFLSGASGFNTPVKKVTVIPPEDLRLPSQKIEFTSCQFILTDAETDIVQYKVTNLGIWSFVIRGDTIRKRIGVYPHVGERIAYSILCWQAVEELSDEWLAPKPHNGHVPESFLQSFCSDDLHFG